nr:hypothetical protein CFP56_79338 [Quercus suber]
MLPRPWQAHVHAPKAMIASIGKQPWQSHTAKFKATHIGKATMAMARSQDQGIPHRQVAKAKATPMGMLTCPNNLH